MPTYSRPYIVLDTETTGTDCNKHDVTQIGAVMLDGLTLEPLPNGEFCSMVRPERWDTIEENALKVTGFTIEQLKEAPSQKLVWSNFRSFVNKFNYKKNPFFAPAIVAYNASFDLGFINALSQKYGDWDEVKNRSKLFGFPTIDAMQLVFFWFESVPDLKRINLDSMRQYLGWPPGKAHDALADAKFTSEIFRRFLHFHRKLHTKDRFKGVFANE